jgi:hypothetical protein
VTWLCILGQATILVCVRQLPVRLVTHKVGAVFDSVTQRVLIIG